MIILGFESSCDETGVAAVCTERGLLAHALHTQIAMHQEYGGVVPELASRDHIRRVTPLTRQVLEEAGIGMADVGAVAYTAGPGLAGALLVGASVAQALAWSRRLPAIGIHHLEGHLLSPMLADPGPNSLRGLAGVWRPYPADAGGRRGSLRIAGRDAGRRGRRGLRQVGR